MSEDEHGATGVLLDERLWIHLPEPEPFPEVIRDGVVIQPMQVATRPLNHEGLIEAGRRIATRKTWKHFGPAVAAGVLIACIPGFLVTPSLRKTTLPLKFRSSDLRGTLILRWNPGVVREFDHGKIAIDDGGRRFTVFLNRSQLNRGEFRYAHKARRIVSAFTAGDLHAQTTYAMPAPRQTTNRGSGTQLDVTIPTAP